MVLTNHSNEGNFILDSNKNDFDNKDRENSDPKPALNTRANNDSRPLEEISRI